MSKTVDIFPGARFYKTDLHIHTSASKCWRDQRDAGSLKRLFQSVKKNGIEVVAITDHNSVENLDEAKRIGKEFGISVYPGVEVSTKEGHVLAIFDPGKKTRDIEDWLIRMGFTSDVRGQDSALARSQENDQLSITKIFDLIENEGGVAIAPHPNSKGVGFLEILKHKGTARQEAYHSRNLRGLEVGKDRENIIKFASGAVPGYKKKYACVSFSDAHSPAEVGEEFTYIKLGDLGIGALKQALYDPAMRIRFADQWPPKSHAWIQSVEVSQGFFKGIPFYFHPDMNSIVGGKATGKSLLIELIRFALAAETPISDILNETLSKVSAPTCLGEGGTITLHVISDNGERYRIQRTFSDLDEGPEIYYADTQTKAAEEVSEVFPCIIYSQNEIIELCKNLPALLDWLDSFIDISKEQQEATSLQKQIELLLAELDSANADASQEYELKKRLKELKDRRDLLNEKIKDPILKQFPLWQKENRLLLSYKEAIVTLRKEVKDFFDNIEVEERFEEPGMDAPNVTNILSNRNELLNLSKQFSKARVSLNQSIESAEEKLNKYVRSWNDAFSKARERHDKTVKDAGVENASAITSELNKAGTQIEKIEKLLQQAKKAATKKSEIEAKLRNELIPKYNACFGEIYKKRVRKADSLTESLNAFVKISVRQMADRRDFTEAIKQLLRGSHLRMPEMTALVARMTPLELTNCITARDVKKLANCAGIDENKATTIIDHVWDTSRDTEGNQLLSPLYGIMFTELRDQVIVELKVHDEAYKPMEELSVGSKCTAILSVALVEGKYPLIVDQPEDALDNPFVFEQIVKTVRNSKTSRQYLFATHNPNVAVASDADLIYCLTATASRGNVDKHGSIDQLSTRDRVVANLEGGKDAFALRSQKYDIEFHDPYAVILSALKED